MIRRLSLAVLFCLAAWLAVGRTSANPGGTASATASATGSIASLVASDAAAPDPGADNVASIGPNVATPPIDTHPPEARWEALLPPGIGGSNGSSRGREHQPQAQAVDLSGAFSPVPWPAGRCVDAGRHAAQFRSPHLLHTPLLI